MKFVNPLTHPVNLVDGREVPIHGEVELTKEQYENPEQWRHLPDVLAGVSASAEKVIAEARENPGKFDNQAEVKATPAENDGGQK